MEGFIFVGLVDFLVDFSVLPRPECQVRDSRLRGLRFSLLVRRRCRLNSRGCCRGFLLDLERFQFLGLVDFLVLPRPECQLAGLASPRASVLAYLSAARKA